MSWRKLFCDIFQVAVTSPTLCITGNSLADKVCREKRLFPLCTTILLSLRLSATGPSGSARKISNNFLAATVVVTSSDPTPKFALVVIWISMSVEIKETLSPCFLKSRFAKIGRVWRRSTIPLTTWRGFSKLSREVLTSCIAFKSLYISY